MSDRRDNANAPALATNGEERASAEQHPAEHDYNPLQSPYAPKKEPGQPTIKENFARSGDATHGSSEGVRDFIERRDGNFNHDVTSGQRELERLAASVRSVQRVEVAARLPRAAQLPSVLGLGPVGDGISPPRSLEPDYLPRRDALRGPRTMIKAIFLIMGIFTVPIAYYFWMGGWDTIPGAPAPDLASFNSKPIIPPRKPSGEAEATTARGGDPGTPAKVGPRTAKSSAGETAAMLQPDTPGAQDPHSSTAAYALDRPKPSSQEELDVAQEDGPRTPAKGEPPTAKSSTAAMLQPATPLAQDPHSSTVTRALDLSKSSSQQETAIARHDDARKPAKADPPTAKSSASEAVAMLQPGSTGAQDTHSSTAAGALNLPKPSTQQETTIARDDGPRSPAKAEPPPHSSTAAHAPNPSSPPETATNDLRTPAKTEPRTAKSSAGEAVAVLQPGAPSAQAPLSSPAARALDAEQIKLLMKQGEQFIAVGDVVTARIAFQRAAEAGDAKAAVALGATYDPTVLARFGVVGISADVAEARSWYRTAEKLGSPEARHRLQVLADH